VNIVSNVNEVPACASLPVDTFFQADNEPTGLWALRQRAAVAVCRSCPLVEACLEAALRFPICEQVGVAGGMSAASRKRILRDRRKAAMCATEHIAEVAA
jgi:WhiB family transcriptional regulator, redox-sensing transcriptional regulator